MKVKKKVLVAALLIIVNGTSCSTMESEPLDYKYAISLPPIQTPPELHAPSLGPNALPLNDSIENLVESSAKNIGIKNDESPKENKSTQDSQIELKQEGALHWLSVRSEFDVIWSTTKQFLLDNNFSLNRENQKVGLLETNWIDESHDPKFASQKNSDEFSNISIRYRYVVQIESNVDTGNMNIYISYNGIQKEDQSDPIKWIPSPSEPALELNMLKLLAIKLGVPKAEIDASVTDTSEEIQVVLKRDAQNNATLHVAEDFARTWHRLAIIMGRLGVTIDDYDRSRGTYFVNGHDIQNGEETAWMARLFKNDSVVNAMEHQRFQLQLKEDNTATIISVLDENGKIINSQFAEKLLTVLQKEIK